MLEEAQRENIIQGSLDDLVALETKVQELAFPTSS